MSKNVSINGKWWVLSVLNFMSTHKFSHFLLFHFTPPLHQAEMSKVAMLPLAGGWGETMTPALPCSG